jgi:hypothetical protein
LGDGGREGFILEIAYTCPLLMIHSLCTLYEKKKNKKNKKTTKRPRKKFSYGARNLQLDLTSNFFKYGLVKNHTNLIPLSPKPSTFHPYSNDPYVFVLYLRASSRVFSFSLAYLISLIRFSTASVIKTII